MTSSSSSSPSSESAELRVLSWNINGLKAKLEEKGLNTKNKRKTALLKIINKYDIVLLQETKIGQMKDPKYYNKNWKIITEALSDKYVLLILEGQTLRETVHDQKEDGEDEDEEEDGQEEGGEEEEKEEEEGEKKTMYLTYFSSNSKGVAIIINKNHTVLMSEVNPFSEGGYYAGVHVEINGQKYTFVSVYYHPDQICDIKSDIVMVLIHSFFTEGPAFKSRLVIGGDFNTTLNPDLDLITENPKHISRRKMLNEFLRMVNMSDVWREKNPEQKEHTYRWKGKDKEEGKSRLDYVFMLKKDVKYVDSCDILNIALSNHFPVRLILNYTKNSVEKSD